MDKRKVYWSMVILAAAFLILLAVWGFRKSRAAENQPSANAAEDSLENYLSEQDTIMAEMMENMKITPSGNASVDFLKGMLPHHQSAIDMAESYLKYGGNSEELNRLAQEIIEAQTAEMEEMNRLIQEIEESGAKDEKKEEGYLKAYDSMMKEHTSMSHHTTSASDVEGAFAEGMKMHHQMAVDMAEAILDYTDSDDVRNLASGIIIVQEQEIRQMEEVLGK